MHVNRLNILITCQSKDKTICWISTQICLTRMKRGKRPKSSLCRAASHAKSLKLKKQVELKPKKSQIQSPLLFFLGANTFCLLLRLLAAKNRCLCLPRRHLSSIIIQILIIRPTKPLVILHINTPTTNKMLILSIRGKERTAFM